VISQIKSHQHADTNPSDRKLLFQHRPSRRPAQPRFTAIRALGTPAPQDPLRPKEGDSSCTRTPGRNRTAVSGWGGRVLLFGFFCGGGEGGRRVVVSHTHTHRHTDTQTHRHTHTSISNNFKAIFSTKERAENSPG